MIKRYSHLKIIVLESEYQYCLIEQIKMTPELIKIVESPGDPVSINFSRDEVSLIAPKNLCHNINCIKSEGDWSCFRIEGDMPFGTVQGLIAYISSSLFEESIGICVVSTFKSDWFFIRSKNLAKAIRKLEANGWTINIEP